MGGQFGQQLAEVGLGFQQGIADQAVADLLQRRQRESAVSTALAGQLAESGQLSNLPADLQRSFQKTLGKDVFQALQFRSGLQQPLEQIRQGAIAQVQAPVQEQRTVQQSVVPASAPPPAASPAALFQQAAGPPDPTQVSTTRPVNVLSQRQPTPEEQFDRFRQLGPVGTSLIGGNELGSLAVAELRANTQRFATTQAEKQQLNRFVIDQAAQGRRVLAPIPQVAFSDDQIPTGFFPVTVGEQVFPVQTKAPDFKFSTAFSEEARARGIDDPRNLTPADSRAIIDRIERRELSKSALRGAAAARIQAQVWRSRPLALNFTDHGFFNTATGDRLPSGIPSGAALDATDGGQIKQLSSTERDDLLNVKRSVNTVNLLNRHIQALYGPGGRFEQLRAQNRIQEGVKGSVARAFQTDPELALAARTVEGLVERIGREFGGQRGVATERDAQRMQALLPNLRILPDTPEVAFGLMEQINQLINSSAQTLLNNPEFTFPNLVAPRAAQPELVQPLDIVKDQSAQLTGTQAESMALGLGLSESQAREVRDAIGNNPVSFEQIQRAIGAFQQQQETGVDALTGQPIQQQQPAPAVPGFGGIGQDIIQRAVGQ